MNISNSDSRGIKLSGPSRMLNEKSMIVNPNQKELDEARERFERLQAAHLEKQMQVPEGYEDKVYAQIVVGGKLFATIFESATTYTDGPVNFNDKPMSGDDASSRLAIAQDRVEQLVKLTKGSAIKTNFMPHQPSGFLPPIEESAEFKAARANAQRLASLEMQLVQANIRQQSNQQIA